MSHPIASRAPTRAESEALAAARFSPESGPGRTLTPEEKAALLADRPDLASPAPKSAKRR